MATFRQEQIDEILNYERSLNRKIYDTEILAVSRMNDERNPPSNRDIKFEAILGGLIDKLKQSIAEAVQSIASKQYPTLNAVNSAKLLALKSGIKGILGAPPNSEQAEQNRLAAEATKKALEASRKAAQSQSISSGTSAEGPSVSLAVDDDGLPDVDENEDDSEFDEDDAYNFLEHNAYGRGRPIRTRHQGFGADFVNKKKRKVGGNPTGAPTVQESETAKSEKSMTKTTENLLYSVIGQYNGIVDKLIEATHQNGLYKNKRLASASNVQYYSNVLKGLNEPLKHLLFEMSQVQQPEVASLFNMIARMIDVIDISPPFQKVDVMSYREGKPDFQGLNDDVVMNDYSGYLKALEKSRTDYLDTIRAFDNAALIHKNTLSKVDDKYKQGIFKEIVDKQKNAQEVLDKLQAEIMNVRKKMKSPLFSITDDLNDKILADVAQQSQMLMEQINSNPSKYNIVKFSERGLTRKQALAMTNLKQEEQVARADMLAKRIKEQQSNVQKMYRIAMEQGGLEDDVTGAHRRAYEEAVSKLQKQLSDFEALNHLPEYRSIKAAVMDRKLQKEKDKLAAQKAQSEGAPAEGAEGEEGAAGDSSGAMGALAAERGQGPQADASKEELEVEEGAEEGAEEGVEEGEEGVDDEEEEEEENEGDKVTEAEERLERSATYQGKSKAELIPLAKEMGIDVTTGQPAPKKGNKKGKIPTKKKVEIIKLMLDKEDEEAAKGEWQTVGPKGKVVKSKSGKGKPVEYDDQTEDESESEYEDSEDEYSEDEEEPKRGKGKPLADLLASPKQQFNSMGRPVSNDDKINNEMIKKNKNWQLHNPRHENPVGSLYPFKAKTAEARYDFPTELRYNRNITNPTKDARGADYSLLQGEIGGPTVNVEAKRQYKASQRQVVTPAQALQNVLSGAGRNKSGALKKLVFDDEDNDMFGEQERGRNSGYIPEDKEDQFKLPDLKKKKEKEAAARLSGRKK